MSIETAIYARLQEDLTVTGLVSTRVSPEWRREGTTLPALVYSVDSRSPVRTLTATTALAEFSVTIDCIAASMSGARALAAAVSAQLNDNATAYSLSNGTLIRWSASDGEDVERMDDQEGTDDGPRVVRQTYRIWATGG